MVHQLVHEESAGVAEIGFRGADRGRDFERIWTAPGVSLKLVRIVAAFEDEIAEGQRFDKIVYDLIGGNILDDRPLFAVLVNQSNELGSEEHAFAEAVEEFGYRRGGLRVSRRSINASSAVAHE